MPASLIEIGQEMQEFTTSMETRRLPSLRIQKRLQAPIPVEPLAHRTRNREKQEFAEPTRDVLLKQQKNVCVLINRDSESLIQVRQRQHVH